MSSGGGLRFPRDWPKIRGKFSLAKDMIEMSAMSMASNPEPVARQIRTFRDALDKSPHQYAMQNNRVLAPRVFQATSKYFGVDAGLVAYTHSTTVGLAQIHGGIRIEPGDEILTSTNEHFTTTEALRLRARRDGTAFRQVPLFRDSRSISTDEVVENISAAIRPTTRVLALTWVYSTDGVKLPIADISKVVQDENASRPRRADPLVFVVDGVHGFGVEDVNFADLGCHLFVAGCHKWIFGPRGTAIACGTEDGWREVAPLIPSFSSAKFGIAQLFMPGGTFAFEHFWALPSAFEFLGDTIGKPNVAARVHGLCARLKSGLRQIKGVTVVTPDDVAFSSGIVAFDVEAMSPSKVAEELADRKARAYPVSTTVSAFDVTGARRHVRLSPAIFNTELDVDRALREIEHLARRSARRLFSANRVSKLTNQTSKTAVRRLRRKTRARRNPLNRPPGLKSKAK